MRFYYEQHQMTIATNRYESYDEGGIVDEYEDEEVLHLWAVYDSQEGHTRPIGYMHTADQARLVCDALNHRCHPLGIGVCLLDK